MQCSLYSTKSEPTARCSVSNQSLVEEEIKIHKKKFESTVLNCSINSENTVGNREDLRRAWKEKGISREM